MAMERVKPKPFDVEVQEVVQETPDSVTLVYAQTPEAHAYKAGQFVTIDPGQFAACRPYMAYLEHLKGKREMPRAYSMSSAPHEPCLAITIKEEPYTPTVHQHPPLLSPLLVHATPKGTKMTLTGFTGPYVLPPDIEERTDHLLHVVAGSGAVPNFSILKDSLHRHPRLRHTFLTFNRTWGDVCFRGPLFELQAKDPKRLKVVVSLTRQEDLTGTLGDVRRGRISLDIVRELLPDFKTAMAYVCGPAITSWERRAALETKTAPTPRFLETTLQALQELGMAKDRIKREAYG
jgi:ferredoxin-NADP reductase